MADINEKFTFYIGDETKVVVEHNIEASIFKDVYNKVFDSIKLFLEQQPQQESSEGIDSENTSLSVNSPNNIFAFVGDRGAGKTSCMMSVANMLRKSINCNSSLPTNKRFEVLETTDPSFFEDNKNILDVVLGRLFKRFKEAYEKIPLASESKKNELLESFEKVKHTLTQMGSTLCEESNIDQLLNLSAGAELNHDIQVLVNKFLKYVDKDVLVIPVDDIDLHTLHAFSMAEQLRKYLIQKNVIILMALKIDQLERVVERHYTEHYRIMLEKEMMDKSLITDMANKYLVKLIPLSHRFPLKSVDELANEPVIIKKGETIVEDNGDALKDVVTAHIFKKTRYLFLNVGNDVSLIIPKNLREIRHLMKFLYEMKNYKDDEQGLYNKSRFIDYFLNTWTNNLSLTNQQIVRELFLSTESTEINKKVVDLLFEKYVKNIVSPDRRRIYRTDDDSIFEMTDIIKKSNVNYNISIGDVFSIIRYCENRITQGSDKAFIFALETLYSIKTYELYNKKIDAIRKKKNLALKEKIPGGTKRKVDFITDYDVVIAGRIINEIEGSLMEHFAENQEYRCKRADFRVISLDSIKKIIKPRMSSLNLNIVEFFALTSSRAYIFEDDDSYRTRDSIAFYEPYTGQQNYVWFSIYSIFGNLANVEQCYNRIDKALYDYADANQDSLLNKIRTFCKDKKKLDSVEESFLSCCSIRNIDVLKKIFEEIKNVEIHKDPIETLENIIDKLASLYVPTYDVVDDSEYYKISFSHLQIIKDFLSKNRNQITKYYDSASQTTIKKINNIQKIIETELISATSSEGAKRSIASRYEDRQSFLDACIAKMALNKSKGLVSSKFREFIDDRPIYRSMIKESVLDDFITWLKSLPVLD